VVFYWVTCVDKYRLKEVTAFVGLDCSTINVMANRTAEGKKHIKNKDVTLAPHRPPAQEQYSDAEKHQSVGEPAILQPEPSALTNCATLPQGTRIHLQLAASRSQKHQK